MTARDAVLPRFGASGRRRHPSRSGARGLPKRVPASAGAATIAGLTCVGLVIWLAWRSGGYFAPDQLVAGTVAFAVLGVLVAVRPAAQPLSAAALVALGCLTGLAAWSGLSAAWSPSPAGALDAMQLVLCHLGIFGLGIVAVGSGRYARHLSWAVLAAIGAIVAGGLVSRFYPGTFNVPMSAFDRYRLAYPLSYFNALGAMAGMGALLGLGLAATPRAPVVLRASAAGIACPLAIAVYLSLSRGAWLAVLAGLVVLVALSPRPGTLLLSGLTVGGFAAIAIVRLRHYPAVVDDPLRGSGQAAQGRAFAPQLALLGVAAGVVQGLLGAGQASESLTGALRRVVRPLLITGVAVAVVLAFAAYAVRSGPVEGWTAERLDDGGSFVSRQWRDFNRPTVFTTEGTARLQSARGSRSDHFRVAIDGFEAHPLRGDGAGGFQTRWYRERRVGVDVRNAHSLPLETIGELGAVGGLFLAGFLGALIAAGVRARRRPTTLARPHAAAVSAALSVWMIHAAADWDWQIPALTGTALVLGACLLPANRSRRRRRPATGDDPPSRIDGRVPARRAPDDGGSGGLDPMPDQRTPARSLR